MGYIVVKDVVEEIHFRGFRSSEDFLEELNRAVSQIIEASALNAKRIDNRTTLQSKDIPLVRTKPKSVIVQNYQDVLYKFEQEFSTEETGELRFLIDSLDEGDYDNIEDIIQEIDTCIDELKALFV